MTLAAGPRNDYLGTGSLDAYSFTFRITAETDLVVTTRNTNDIETTLVLNTGYTVSTGPWPSGGTITLLAGNLTSGYALTIRRERPFTQEFDAINGAALYPETIEAAFDDVVMIAQQLNDARQRSLRLGDTDPMFGARLPAVDLRAGKFLAFDAAGDPSVSAGSGGGDTSLRTDLAASGGSALVGFLQDGTGATLRTTQSKLRERLSATDFNTSIVFGVTDATTYIQQLLDAVPVGVQGGRRVHIPAGIYKITDTLHVRDSTILYLMGESMRSTIFDWHGGNNQAVLQFESLATSALHGNEASHFTIRNGNAATGLDGIRSTYLSGAGNNQVMQKFSRILVDGQAGMANGIQIIGQQSMTIDDCYITDCVTGVLGTVDGSGRSLEDCGIFKSHFIACSAWCIDIPDVTGVSIRRNQFRSAASNAGGVRLDKANGIEVVSNTFTLSATLNQIGLYLGPTALGSNTASGASVLGNDFNLVSAASGSVGIKIDFMRGAIVGGNSFLNTETGILVTANAAGTTILDQSWATGVGTQITDASISTLILDQNYGLHLRGALALNGTGSAPDQSVGLDFQATTLVPRLPRLTTTQRDALTPATGMILYNSTTATIQGFFGGSWQNL